MKTVNKIKNKKFAKVLVFIQTKLSLYELFFYMIWV